MKEIIYRCCHCDKKLDPMNDYTEMELSFNTIPTEVDLCVSCANDLLKMIQDFLRGDENR